MTNKEYKEKLQENVHKLHKWMHEGKVYEVKKDNK